MSSISKQPEVGKLEALPASGALSPHHAPASNVRPQPTALEISVSVNGARSIAGSDKREPFSESTKTVLVFGTGTVIRLSSSVATGQLLFLTNDKTKKEVVCQVVKSKHAGNASGYVELEFTEPMAGFWGMRFPDERTPLSPVARQVTALPPQVTESVPAPPSKIVPRAAEPSPIAAAPPAITPPIVPTAISAPPASNEALRLHSARVKERLSSMTFDVVPQNQPAAPLAPPAPLAPVANVSQVKPPIKIVPRPAPSIAPLPATAAPTKPFVLPSASLLDEEEIKVPAWLETAVHHTANSSHSSGTPEYHEAHAVSDDALADTIPLAEATATYAPAAMFGNTLLDEQHSDSQSASRGSRKGIVIAAIAASLLVTAAGATWYVRESVPVRLPAITAATMPAPAVAHATLPSALASTTSPDSSGTVAAAPSANSASLGAPAGPGGTATTGSGAAPRPAPAVSPQVVSTVSSASTAVTGAVTAKTPSISRGGAAPGTLVNASSMVVESRPTQPVAAQPKKPSLGNVHLSAPTVYSSAPKVEASGADLNLGGSAPSLSSGDSLNASLTGGATRGPSAPVVVGGQVRPAKLIYSSAPVYPAIARAQHVAGEVRVDAVIDSAGHVTSANAVSGPQLLYLAAASAIRQWKYQPAQLDGKPVSTHLTVVLRFKAE